MDKFRGKYRIPSDRAAWHEYDAGVYFVTICTAERAHYFGEIDDGVMQLSEIGIIVKDCFARLSSCYPYAEIPLFVIMPNHVHAIVVISGNDANGNDDGRDAIHRVSVLTATATEIPRNPMTSKSLGTVICGGDVSGNDDGRDAMNRVSGLTATATEIPRNPMTSKSLGTVIRGMKARVSRAAHRKGISFGWQARFYDHIIRNIHEMNRIAEYIENNAAEWDLDEMNIDPR